MENLQSDLSGTSEGRSGARPGPVNVSLGALLVIIMVLALLLIGTLRAQQQLAQDRAEINSVKYGLLNADAWVEQVAEIVNKKVKTFELTAENRAAIKLTLQRMLDTLITEADRQMRSQEKRGNWWRRTATKVKLSVKDTLIDMEEVKRGIPGYADAILDEMVKPEPREELNSFIRNLLANVTSTTFADLDRSRVEAIHSLYGCKDRPACQAAIGSRIEAAHLRAIWLALAVLALSAAMLITAIVVPGRGNPARLSMLALCSTVLLACGVLTPMIEVEARISVLRFMLLGEPVMFTDQTLYFQSKSVLDVVRVMTATGAADMIAIGGLIMLFSVIFPLAKLGASLIYLYDARGLRQSRVVNFFALKSGKWSMADVFVVAIFMAYIGFNGLISSQLSNFAAANGDEVDVLTTNGTTLQIGFFMFLAFCIASLLTSTVIDSTIRQKLPQS